MIPVINPTTSVMGYLQGQTWEYLPIASNSPTGWSATTLPPGMVFDSTTGTISGAATTAGLYMVNLVATNGDGPSAPVALTIRIEPQTGAAGSLSNLFSGADIVVDVGTGGITFPTALVLKEDDDQMLFVTFQKNGTTIDLGTLSALQFVVKEFEPDQTVVLGNTFRKLSSGLTALYQLYVHVDSDALAAALSNYEQDLGTSFKAVCEIEWKEPRPNGSSFGPSVIRRSTALFTVPIFRNVALI